MVGMSAVLALHNSIRAVFPSAVTSCGWSAWHVSRRQADIMMRRARHLLATAPQ
jgi:hypothetical protein